MRAVANEREPPGRPDELVTCILSGERRPRSEMLAYGDQFVAPEHKDAFIRRLESGLAPVGGQGFAGPLDGTPGQVVSQSLRLTARNAPVLLALSVAFLLPRDLATGWFDWHFVDSGGFLGGAEKPFGTVGSFGFAMLLEFTLGVVAYGGFLAAAHRSWEGRGRWWAVVDAFRCWPRLCMTYLLGMISILIGLVFLIVPGLVIATRFYVSGAACVAEGRFPASALGRSWSLSAGRFWTCFVIAILAEGIVTVLPLAALSLVLVLAPDLHWISTGLVTWAFSLPSALATVVGYVLFRHLAAGEGGGRAVVAA
jgi:hypothetical protein